MGCAVLNQCKDICCQMPDATCVPPGKCNISTKISSTDYLGDFIPIEWDTLHRSELIVLDASNLTSCFTLSAAITNMQKYAHRFVFVCRQYFVKLSCKYRYYHFKLCDTL